MALQVSQYPQLRAEDNLVGRVGLDYSWHIDKNVAQPVALAMLPALTQQVAKRGLLLLVCDAAIGSSPLKAFAAATAAQAILRSYYYKTEASNFSHMLFQAMLEGIRESNDAVAHFFPNAGQEGMLTVTDNLAGISATAVVAHDNKVIIGSLGDTRAYRLRGGKLAPYEQGEQERLIILEDDFRKGDRVFVCTQALVAANGTARIRAAAKASAEGSPAALRALIEAATDSTSTTQEDSADILAAALLQRNAARSTTTAAVLTTNRPMTATTALPPLPRVVHWLTWASILAVLAIAAWLLLAVQRNQLAITFNSASAPRANVTTKQQPVATSLMPVPVLDSHDNNAAIANTENLSVVITTSEAGIVVFQLAATETPVPEPTPIVAPTLVLPTLTPTLEASPSPLPTATVTKTRAVRPTITSQPIVTVVPAQPTSPPPQPQQPPPPQPTSPPAQPTSPPPQPTSPPPQPTSPPPQPTSPPPQPTSPPAQPTSPPPQPTSPPPPPPDVSLPCLPGDTQCKP